MAVTRDTSHSSRLRVRGYAREKTEKQAEGEDRTGARETRKSQEDREKRRDRDTKPSRAGAQ